MKNQILVLLILTSLLGYSQNTIEWNGEKESFEKVAFWGGDENAAFPKELRLINDNWQGKKFSFIRISGFTQLNSNEEINFCETSGSVTRMPTNPDDKCLIHVGIIDGQNEHHYYQAKTATLKGLGNNTYELIADFHDVDAVGNPYTNSPDFPNYTLKATFNYVPKKR